MSKWENLFGYDIYNQHNLMIDTNVPYNNNYYVPIINKLKRYSLLALVGLKRSQ